MHYLTLLLLLCVSIAYAEPETADTDKAAMIQQLEKTLSRVTQESQSTYQQFLMIQELRRNEMMESPENIPLDYTGKSIPIPNYQDLMRRRLEKKERIDQYTADLDRLYARYKSLESEKETLFEKIRALEQKKSEN